MRCLSSALARALPSWLTVGCWACANKAFSCQISLVAKGEHVSSVLMAAETTLYAARPTEPEAAQTLLDPMGSIGTGEN